MTDQEAATLQSSPDERTRCFGSQLQKEHKDFSMQKNQITIDISMEGFFLQFLTSQLTFSLPTLSVFGSKC
jgi:hypothetical protein